MSHKKKPEAARRGEIESLLSGARPVEKSLAELERQNVDLSCDPEFLADFLKAHFVEQICQVMAEESVTKAALAERLGKSRQYVGKVLNETANFTIETMVALCCALERKLEIRVLKPRRTTSASVSHEEALADRPGADHGEEVAFVSQDKKAEKVAH